MNKNIMMYIRQAKQEVDLQDLKEKVTAHFYSHKKLYITAYAVFLNTVAPATAFATGGVTGGISLIKLMQQASFWIGLGVSIWGVVEAQLDYPGWKGRVMKGVLGYVAILLLPLIFIELRDNLQVDVWQQLEGGE